MPIREYYPEEKPFKMCYVEAKFVKDFVKAWNKVMNLDRYDLKA